MQNAVGDEPCNKAAVGHKQRCESDRHVTKKPQPTTAIGMQGHKIQIEPRYLKKEAAPNENTIVPPKQNELKDGNTDKRVPEAGGVMVQARACNCGIPGIGAESETRPPDVGSCQKSEEQQGDFRGQRVSHAHG